MRKKENGAARKRSLHWLLYLAGGLMMVGGIVLARSGNLQDDQWLRFGGILLMLASLAVVTLGVRRYEEDSEQELEQMLDELESEEADAEPLTPGAAPPDLFVMGYPSDVKYQVVPGERELHFVRLGWGELLSEKAIDRLLEPGLTDAEIRAAMEKGFSVPWREIESVDVTFKRCVSTQLENFGIFSLRTGGRRRRFILLSRDETWDTPERLRAFFAPAAGVYTADTKRRDAQKDAQHERREAAALRAETQNPALLKKLRLLGYALPALAVLTGLVWRFLPVPYDLFSAICVALALLPMALVAAWPRWFSVSAMLELRQGEEKLVPNTVDLTTAVIAGGIFPMLGGFADFNVLNWGWLVGVAALFALVMTLLMTRGLTLKKLWLRRALIWLMLSMFSIGAVLEVNYLLDYCEPAAEEAVITDKSVSGGRSTSYDLCFAGDRSYSVTKEDFDALEVGDTVMLVEHRGALGVRYVDVWMMADWYADGTKGETP